MTDTPTMPAHVLPHRTPTQLLTIARQGLAEAARTRADGLRYATAHLAALRAATAVLAARTPTVTTERRRLTSVWALLAEVAPEMNRWAEHFAAGSSKRAAAEAGIPRAVTAEEADDLLRAAGQFVTVVETALGVRTTPDEAGSRPPADDQALPAILAAIDNALRNGSYMTSANLAFGMLCDRLGVDRDRLEFRPDWAAAAKAEDQADSEPARSITDGKPFRWDPSENCYCGGPEATFAPHRRGTGRHCREEATT